MFLDFLLLLRAGGLKVSLNEWLALTEGMSMGLHRQSVHGFYILCRSLIVKNESSLDKFDELFYRFFKDVTANDLEKELRRILRHPEEIEKVFEEYMKRSEADPEAIRKALEARLAVPDATDDIENGRTPMNTVTGTSMGIYGDSADAGAGTVIQGAGGRSTVHAQGDRKFRDWRTDSTLESRQFQMAFRLLRELSRKLDSNEEELDIRGTIDKTCRLGGILDISMQPPRRNRLKVMVLIDSGGSMKPYEQLCSLLFQSLHKANTFSDLKIYYFHNYLEGQLYKDPSIDPDNAVRTEWVLRNIGSSYRVIFVGDAEMALHELMSGSGTYGGSSSPDGITWFRRFEEHYDHSIWLHPQPREENEAWMSDSFIEIEKVFPMFRLSIDGLKEGMYKLMENN